MKIGHHGPYRPRPLTPKQEATVKKLRAGYSMCVIARNEGVSKNAIYTRVEAICKKLGKDRDTFFAELPKQKTYTIMDIALRLERLEEIIRQLVKE